MNAGKRTALVGVLALLGAAPAPAAVAATERPNVIVILTDDQGYGHFGPNVERLTPGRLNPRVVERDAGSYAPATAIEMARRAMPTLSRLAEQGTRMSSAYVASPLCAPSRAGLMTGRYPSRFGLYNNVDARSRGVPTDETLLPTLFQEAGYATAAIGKWHLGTHDQGLDEDKGMSPLQRGFDYFFGFDSHGTEYYESEILFRGHDPAEAEGYLTEQLNEEAVAFVRRAGDRPFFLYLSHAAVHNPLNKPAPDRYRNRFDSDDFKLDNFYAYLNAVDAGVGEILRALEETGEADHTLIVYLSDNGAPGGATHPLPHNAPYRGFKGQLWQGGTRVPMVLWWPGQVPAGEVSDEPVISLDVLPTALAAAGLEVPAGLEVDGRDMLPAVAGELDDPLHEALFWTGQEAQNWAIRPRGEPKAGDAMTAPAAWAVRSGPWMLRYWAGSGRHELYDVTEDPFEVHDLSDDRPAIVKRLRARYADWIEAMPRPARMPPDIWRDYRPGRRR